MSKELPYFRFTVQEWQNGDITLEDLHAQGLFINVCCYYWICNCSVAIEKLKRRFINAEKTLNALIEKGIIKTDASGEYVQIDYLNEQYDTLSNRRKKYQKAGKLGGLKKSSNAKASLKQRSSYKDKDKDKDNTSEITCFPFNSFWNLYDKKRDRIKCEKLYSKVSELHREVIKQKLPLYIQSTPDIKYRKNPQGYLSGQRWNDEINELKKEVPQYE